MSASEPVLAVEQLTVRIPTAAGTVHAVTDVDLTLRAGRVHALVGESGCGKSVTGAAICGLLPATATVGGRVLLRDRRQPAAGDRPHRPAGRRARVLGHHGAARGLRDGAAPVDLVAASPKTWRRIRGRRIAWIPQSAATYFTPVRTIGAQLAETCAYLESPHRPAELLDLAGLAPAAADLYPHELSGGMAQRAAIACALAATPQVIVADEPTASLDPILTEHTLTLLRAAADAGAAVLLISHDLDTLAEHTDHVAVMYASRILETGPTAAVFADPWHPYTRDLLAATPAGGLHPIPGTPPALTDPAGDCVYHLRRPAPGFSGGPTHLTTHGDRTVRRLIGAAP
ncbi:ATP-binding cassette domain-containing protein [Nocardia higoensis]|uniref:ATP-binding cassette domain-containing protein n=1 Tax=Nocardia higoensis TaxID=228599 RepID=UPI0003060485|nr:ABC transporter ATP-binding protein [Nocardia higoensis]